MDTQVLQIYPDSTKGQMVLETKTDYLYLQPEQALELAQALLKGLTQLGYTVIKARDSKGKPIAMVVKRES